MSTGRSTSTCDNDKLWIEEFLNMDDDIHDYDDEYHYCSSSSDFVQPCTNNNTYLGASTTAGPCPELHHDQPPVTVPQIQGQAEAGEFKISSPAPSKRRKMDGEDLETTGSNITHITVERNRRKQMNHNLSLLRSLMPSFYVKRGDQASIIGGVIDYINELQLLLQSLEAKKHRKLVVYNELVLSPSPRKPPLSPRLILPISPTTPQPTSPYKPPPPLHAAATATGHYSPTLHVELPPILLLPSPSSAASSSNVVCVNELAASSKSAMANVEVKFSGQNNLLLKTTSQKIPGQALKIIWALEKLALEILHVSISIIDDTMLNSFTIKIGIECQLSAEELAQQVQQTFC